MIWSAAVLIFGTGAIAHSSLPEVFGPWLYLTLIAITGLTSWFARRRLSRFIGLVCTSRGRVALVTAAGKVESAQPTGRNLRVPGLWLLEVTGRRRDVVIVDLKNSTRWDIALLQRRLRVPSTEVSRRASSGPIIRTKSD